MKKFAKSLIPLAVLVLFGACLLSCISLLVVFLTSVGFADQVPWSYYEKLNIGVISVVAPAVGMMFFWLILLGLREKTVEDVKPAIIESDVILPASEEERREERLPKAA